MPVVNAEQEKARRLYEWLREIANARDLPWGHFGKIERELQCTKTALVVDYRQIYPDESFASEMDEELDSHDIGVVDDDAPVIAIVPHCQPDYAMELFRSVAEAVAACNSMGLRAEIHVYDLPAVYH